MDKDQFDQWFSEAISEWVDEAVATSDNLVLEEDTFSDTGDFFREIGLGADALNCFLRDHDYKLTLSSCYSLLGTAIEFALDSGWLEQEDQWAKIMDLFFTRANEFVGDEQTIELENTDIPHVRAIKIVEFIVYNFDLKAAAYAPNDFLIHEKLSIVREIILGFRTNRFIESTPLLSRLLSTLYTDWRVLGGGFSGSMGMGNNPWSHT